MEMAQSDVIRSSWLLSLPPSSFCSESSMIAQRSEKPLASLFTIRASSFCFSSDVRLSVSLPNLSFIAFCTEYVWCFDFSWLISAINLSRLCGRNRLIDVVKIDKKSIRVFVYLEWHASSQLSYHVDAERHSNTENVNSWDHQNNGGLLHEGSRWVQRVFEQMNERRIFRKNRPWE